MKNYIIFATVFLMFGCNSEPDKAQVKSVDDTSTKEVLLVGTFHFNNPGADVAKTKSFDILNENAQNELEKMSTNIKEYNPSKIFVEWPYNEQEELDSLYQLYLKGEYFKNDGLSDFYKKNEIFQLAFRVAKKNNLKKVYGIDYSTSFPYQEVMNDIENSNQSELKSEIEGAIAKFSTDFNNKIDSGASLKELMYYVNSKEMRYASNDVHNNLFSVAGSINDFNGVYLTSEWYRRNLYMWSLIQKHTTKSDERIMVLLGSSHIALIELFVRENRDWKIKELNQIIPEA